MGEFGQALRALREAHGYSLEQVAETTRIRVRHLQSLESEQFEGLPSDASARGFVRQLARHLKADERELLRQFESALTPRGPVSAPAAVAPTNATVFKVQPSGRHHTGLGVGIGIVVIILLALGWMRGNQGQLAPARVVLAGKSEPAGGSSRRPPAEKASPPLNESKPVVDAPSAGGSTDRQKEATAKSPIVPSAQPDTIQSTVLPAGNAPLRLEFQANEQSWVQAALDGGDVKEALLKPGERLLWTAKELMEVTIGNAGGLALTFNGQSLSPLGEPGKVVRLRVTKDGVTTPPPQRKSTPRPQSLPPSALAF